MPDLSASLLSHDLGHLRIVADLWGIELTGADADACREQLCAALLDPGLAAEIVETLPPEARAALDALTAKNGRIPLGEFSRRFGEVREMGAGKRDREQPHRRPKSAAEILYYRALLATAFFETPSGPQEFAYIPDDLNKIINHKGHEEHEGKIIKVRSEPLGRPASPVEKAYPLPANDWLLDDATILLAALRMGLDDPADLHLPAPVIRDLLAAARILAGSTPQPDSVKAFLEATRAEALKQLTDAWLDTPDFDELRQVPGIVCEGEWRNDPPNTRRFLLALLEVLPQGQWWSLTAFIRSLKAQHPDFQRPAGDYDSWFVKRQSDGLYLRGFAHWDEVDGALVRYLVTGPLHWLGMVELAAPEEGKDVSAFRVVSDKGKGISENGKLVARSNGQVIVPRFVPRAVRYQVARFGEWLDPKKDDYVYLLTPASLTRARQQGLKVEHLLALLNKSTGGGIPPSLVKALKRWEVNGTEARVQETVVLRVSRPEVLDELRRSKAGRFLGEPLGPTAVIVKPGAQSKVMAALAEMGLLAEDGTGEADIL
ncbi:MAG: helicase-associated domain-containing protein [Chloroflexota bacterium]